MQIAEQCCDLVLSLLGKDLAELLTRDFRPLLHEVGVYDLSCFLCLSTQEDVLELCKNIRVIALNPGSAWTFCVAMDSTSARFSENILLKSRSPR